MDGFETERLIVTRWTDAINDTVRRAQVAKELHGILTDPVLAHLPPSLQGARTDIEEWITARDAESEVYLVRGKDGALRGLLILARMGAGEPIHIGYLLAEAAWGHEYATELVRGLINALIASAPLDLRAGVEAGNPASSRVLEKAGFLRVHPDDASGQAMYHLHLSRSEPQE